MSTDTILIQSFTKLVTEGNQIPDIHIDLNKPIDKNRDALAFTVRETYRQFQSFEWKTALDGLIHRMQTFTSLPPIQAKGAMIGLIKQCFESRLLAIKNDPAVPDQKKRTRQILSSYNRWKFY